MGEPTETWLVAVDEALATRIVELAPDLAAANGSDVRVEKVARSDLLIDSVLRLRPRVVILAEPPVDAPTADRLLAERGSRPAFRILHLTPLAAVDRRLRALDLGVDQALPLSVGPAELVARARIEATRGRRRSDASNVVPLSQDSALDLVAHELRRGGETIHLRPKEYGLLALLATHPGRVYSRRQLLDRVWGVDHAGDSRTVDVHVRWLRAKIEPDPDRPRHLVTVRGIGYRFDRPLR